MSLGVDFTRRRMMAATKTKSKYVWAVYDISYGRDDQNVITGSKSYTNYAYLMVGTSYTVTSSGFKLVNADDVTNTDLAAGMYAVELPEVNMSSTATTGQYLYEITGVYETLSLEVQYKKYSLGPIKSDTELYRVESENISDYPVNGVWDDGKWYMLLMDYTWYVYNTKEVLDDSKATTGSFSITSTYKKMAASKFTLSGSTFSLTSSTSTAASSLQAGQYIVNISTYWSSNTTTSGTYLYLITSVTTSSSRTTVSYKRYSANAYSKVRGDTLLREVSADTPIYPSDGIWEGDGNWYVIVKGASEMHVWKVYKEELVVSSKGYSLFPSSSEYILYESSLVDPIYYIESSDVSAVPRDANGFKLSNYKKATSWDYIAYTAMNTGWIFADSSRLNVDNGSYAYFNKIFNNYGGTNGQATSYPGAMAVDEHSLVPSKSSTLIGTLESSDTNAYTHDGYIEGTGWVVYSHSYGIEIDNT